MKRRKQEGRKRNTAQRKDAARPLRRPAKPRKASGDTPKTELQNLIRERDEALEQLNATSEVLRVIATSPGDLQPVFEAVLENAVRICQANFAILTLRENDAFRFAAMHNAPAAFAELRQREPVIRPGPLTSIARVAATKKFDHIFDLAEEAGYKQRDPAAV